MTFSVAERFLDESLSGKPVACCSLLLKLIIKWQFQQEHLHGVDVRLPLTVPSFREVFVLTAMLSDSQVLRVLVNTGAACWSICDSTQGWRSCPFSREFDAINSDAHADIRTHGDDAARAFQKQLLSQADGKLNLRNHVVADC